MTPSETLTALTDSIVKAVPDIRCKLCVCAKPEECEHVWRYRDITLEDVLRAFHEIWKSKEQYSRSYVLAFMLNEMLDAGWQLGLPLHQQPEPTIQFLASLLLPNA